MKNGWTPLPVLLKVVFILLIIGMSFSLFSALNVFRQGYSFLGFNFTGLPAVLIMVLMNIVCSFILVAGMWMRKRWTWVFALCLFFFNLINGLINLAYLEMRLGVAMDTRGIYEEAPRQFAYAAGILIIVLSSLFNAGCGIVFIIYRKYFQHIHSPEENPAESSNAPSADQD